MIIDNNVRGVCDIPFEKCDQIFVVGKKSNQVALLMDNSKKKCCAVSLDKHEVGYK